MTNFGSSQPLESTQSSSQSQETIGNNPLQNEALSSQPQPISNGQWRANYGQVAPIFGAVPGTDASTGYVPGQSTSIAGAPIYQPGETEIPTNTTPTPFGSNGYSGSFTSPNYYNTPSEGTYSQVPTTTTQEQPGGSFQQNGSTGTEVSGQNGQPTGTAFNPNENGNSSSQNGNSGESSTGQSSSGQNGGAAFNPNASNSGKKGSGDANSGNSSSSGSGDSSSGGFAGTPAKPIEALAGAFLGAGGGVLGARLVPRFVHKITHGKETAAATDTTEATTTEATTGARGDGAVKGAFKYVMGKDNKVSAKFDEWQASGKFDKVSSFLHNNFGYENAQRKNLQDILDNTNKQITALGNPEEGSPEFAKLNTLKTQQDLLSAGPEKTGVLNPELFTQDGKSIVDQLKENGGLGADATKFIEKHDSNLDKAFPDLADAGTELPAGAKFMDRFSNVGDGASLLDRTGQNTANLFTKHPWTFDAAQGAVLAGGFLAGSALINKVTHTDGSLRLSTIGVPLAVLGGESTGAKVGLALGVVGASTLIDHIMPASSHPALSHIFAPNGNDAVLMTAGYMVPGSTEMKMAGVGGAYAFDRITAAPALQAAIGTGALTGAAAWATHAGKLAGFGLNSDDVVPVVAAGAGIYLGSRVLKAVESKL